MGDQKAGSSPSLTAQSHDTSKLSSLISPDSDTCDIEKSASAKELLERVAGFPVEDIHDTPVLDPRQSLDQKP